jgi:hypothetical protein
MLFKAHPYLLFGRPQPGKIHGLRDPSQKQQFVTLRGLTPARCPGKLVEGGDEEITCKTCQNKLADPIKWYCWGYSETPDWRGYVNGKLSYRIFYKNWQWVAPENHEDWKGGSCSDEEDGQRRCLEHYFSTRGKVL